MATVVEGDPKVSFSIATTPRCREERNSFPWIAPFYPRYVPYNAVLSKEISSTVFFFSIWYDSTWDWIPVSWTIGEHYSQLANAKIGFYGRLQNCWPLTANAQLYIRKSCSLRLCMQSEHLCAIAPMTLHPRGNSAETSLLSWFSQPGTVLLKRHVHQNRYDLLVSEMELPAANPHQALIQHYALITIGHLALDGRVSGPQKGYPSFEPINFPTDCTNDTLPLDSFEERSPKYCQDSDINARSALQKQEHSNTYIGDSL